MRLLRRVYQRTTAEDQELDRQIEALGYTMDWPPEPLDYPMPSYGLPLAPPPRDVKYTWAHPHRLLPGGTARDLTRTL